MTPQQKIKQLILHLRAEFADEEPPAVTAENVDDLYAQAEQEGDGNFYDAHQETRGSGIDTNVPAPSSRHYEAKSVGTQAVDGSWVGWTYWYGGGKHGEPEAVEWIDEAYDLTVTEEERTITHREFTKVVAP